MKITERIENIDLFNGQDAFLIMQLTDFHLWFSISLLSELKFIIDKIKPDLIFLTGDYFDIPKGAKNFKLFVEEISKRFTVVYIYGNHDRLYKSISANLLCNIPNCFCVENEVFKYTTSTDKTLNITSWSNRRELKRVEGEVNIVLIHNPEKITEAELGVIDLIFAGHLHGGQFIFWKTKQGEFFPGNLVYKYCIDRKEIKNTTIIVSKGLGDTFPFRINCPKEVVLAKIS